MSWLWSHKYLDQNKEQRSTFIFVFQGIVKNAFASRCSRTFFASLLIFLEFCWTIFVTSSRRKHPWGTKGAELFEIEVWAMIAAFGPTVRA